MRRHTRRGRGTTLPKAAWCPRQHLASTLAALAPCRRTIRCQLAANVSAHGACLISTASPGFSMPDSPARSAATSLDCAPGPRRQYQNPACQYHLTRRVPDRPGCAESRWWKLADQITPPRIAPARVNAKALIRPPLLGANHSTRKLRPSRRRQPRPRNLPTWLPPWIGHHPRNHPARWRPFPRPESHPSSQIQPSQNLDSIPHSPARSHTLRRGHAEHCAVEGHRPDHQNVGQDHGAAADEHPRDDIAQRLTRIMRAAVRPVALRQPEMWIRAATVGARRAV